MEKIIKVIRDTITKIKKERECYDSLHSDKIYHYAMSEQIDILEYIIEKITTIDGDDDDLFADPRMKELRKDRIYEKMIPIWEKEEEEIALTKHLRGEL
tara:strand:+ start:76 stop:372 length:297 start_codon:yes stop_codon:yes gene_type:complete